MKIEKVASNRKWGIRNEEQKMARCWGLVAPVPFSNVDSRFLVVVVVGREMV